VEKKMNKRAGKIIRVLLGLSLLFSVSCGALGDPSAKTAQEFVEKYSKAYSSGNAGLIAKMTEAKGRTEESYKEEAQKDIDSKGFGYVAWSNARYVSEEDRGNYIRVNVEIQGARSSIILVKRDGLLKLTLNPGDYNK
jgi:hypothetical protein